MRRHSRLERLLYPLRLCLRTQGMAFAAFRAFKLRGVFIITAVALGVASLTVIIASVDGARKRALAILEGFGPDAVMVAGGDIKNRPVGQRRLTIAPDDVERVKNALAGVYEVIPLRVVKDVRAASEGAGMDLKTVYGGMAGYGDAWNWPVAEGRDLTDEDVEQAAKVCLLGSDAARELFSDRPPIGGFVRLRGIPLEVVGVLRPRGFAAAGGGSPDECLVTPITTLTRGFNMSRTHYTAMRVKFDDPEDMRANAAGLKAFMRRLHGLEPGDPDDFSIVSPDEILNFLTVFTGGVTLFLGVTAVVAIVAGGFVLANLFLLSVSERGVEIGLKKALGASKTAVTLQFLFEAAWLTLAGAVLGMALGVGAARLLAEMDVLKISLSPKIAVISLAGALLIALVFGLGPARRAAGVDPVQALRGE